MNSVLFARAAVAGALVLAGCMPEARCQQPAAAADEYIGEFSGWSVPVSRSNYYLVRNAIAVFGTRWGEQPRTEQDLEDRTWEQLVLSFEAHRRGIQVEEKDVDEEVTKTLQGEKADFDWKKDPEAFSRWAMEKTRQPAEVFKNQLRHLLQLEKLRAQVLESFRPQVSEEEAYEEFLNEYHTLELELAQFDELKDAEAFYANMTDPARWDEENEKDPKFAKRPGFVSAEFLMHFWKIPREALFEMVRLNANATYPPTPIYKGYGVFRVLKTRPAEDADFAPRRDSYFKQVEMMKKYDELKVWLAKLKEDARIKVYPARQGQGQ